MSDPAQLPPDPDLALLRGIYDSADIGICVTDDKRCFVQVNDAYCRTYGYTRQELVGRPFTDVLPEDQRDRAGRIHDDFIAGGSESAGEWEVVRKDGQLRNVLVTAGRVRAPAEDRVYKVTTVQDVTEIRARDTRLRQLSLVVEQTQHGVIFTDAAGLTTWVNEGTEKMVGYTLEEMYGRKPGELLQSELTDADTIQHMHRQLEAGEGFRVDILNRTRSGKDVWIHIACSPVMDQSSELKGFIALQTDISERERARQRIEELSFRDPLTGLANRRLLEERLNFCLASSRRTGSYNAVLLLDLDNFKVVNDAIGPSAGDKLLIDVARTLLETLYESDLVARIGGDEFVAVLSNLSEDVGEAALGVEHAAQRILASLAQPFTPGGQTQPVTASIGTVLFAGEEGNGGSDVLLQKADIAMYQAKAAGKNTFVFFEPEAQHALVARHRLEIELREAIRVRQLVPHYQGQVDRNGALVGAELLIRWQHPERGLLRPADFIPLAEETGMIADLGEEVVRLAVEQIKCWARNPETSGLVLAVNISPTHFERADFENRISELLRLERVGPGSIKLEITESALASDVERLIRTMMALHRAGVSFALDDFGTGYSSLAYLKRLPITQIKIDQGFVRDILDDEDNRGITETIVALARTLRMDVIAEGVETEAQRDLLLALGCERFQGYLFDKPAPVEEFESRYGLRTTAGTLDT